jgi:hypothetical protein
MRARLDTSKDKLISNEFLHTIEFEIKSKNGNVKVARLGLFYWSNIMSEIEMYKYVLTVVLGVVWAFAEIAFWVAGDIDNHKGFIAGWLFKLLLWTVIVCLACSTIK